MKLFQSLNGSQGGFSIWMLIWTLLFLASLSIMALCFAKAAQINQTYADLRDQSSALSFNFVQVEDNLDEAIDGDLFAAGQVSQASDAIETIVGTFANGDSFNNQDALNTELVPIFPEIRSLWDDSRAITEGFVEESRSFGDAKDLVENILDVVPELTFFVSQMNNSAKIENLGQVDGVIPIVDNIVVQTEVVSDGLRVLADEGGVAASLATSKSRDGLALIRNDLLNLLDKPEVYDFPDFINALTEANAIISTIEDQIDEISDISLINSRTIEGASTVSDANGRIRSLVPNLEAQLDNGYNTSEESTNLAYIFAALALVSFLGLLATIYIRTRRQLKITQESSNKNERAILRLLDEMATLAEGDLTVQATVTEDMTGAIADAVNYAIEALRSLVTTINSTSGHVSVAAEKTRSTALKLASASDRQAKQIVSATRSVNEMTTSIETVSKGAQDSAKVAEKAVSIAKKGVETVQRTIDGMDVIRQQIQDTSKRIKRLGESSQEIGEIVRLINDIADQTNILALNAAIQASSAGEAGRGFAVVADEVQRLAERSANATKQIEALVKTIQADTNEAVSSMELSTANVVKGTQNARDAGDALSEVEGVSNELAKLISEISNAAKEQALASVGIANTMNSIREVTVQTSTGTNETAQSIGNLAEMAGELRQSVDGFKLPEEDLALDIDEMVEAIEEEPVMIDSVVG